jgi:hypothetical protein
MLQFDEYKVKLNNLAPALKDLAQALDLEAAERELDMLQSESASDGFWDNLAKAQKVQQRIKVLQDKVDGQAKRQGAWDDLMALCEMGNEFEDESLIPELEEGAVLERGQVGYLEGNGAEAVVPLHQNKKWTKAVAEDMDSAMGGSSSQVAALLRDILEILEAMADAGTGLDQSALIRALVALLAKPMDKKLGQLQAAKARA